MSSDTATRHLIVAGDILNDRHFYSGERRAPVMSDRRGVRVKSQHGGAHLLHRLIDRLLRADALRSPALLVPGWKAELAVEPPPLTGGLPGYDGYAIWQPFPPSERDRDGPPVWRAAQMMGYGHLTAHEVDGLRAPSAVATPDPDLLILDDAGFLFRHATGHASWALAARGIGPVLLKMSEPLVQGALWRYLLGCCADRLVCLLSARDLRREKLGLGRGLSWEATLDDLRLALFNHPAASQLQQARHLVVTFSADAALWLDQTDRATPRAFLVFDPTRAEGEWETQFPGDAFGFHIAMTAALALGLAKNTDEQRATGATDPHAARVTPELLPAVEGGLLAMRDLKQHGHGPVGGDLPDGYPVERIAAKILDTCHGGLPHRERLAHSAIDWPATPAMTRAGWSIIERSRAGGARTGALLLDLAWDVAIRGTAALEGVPHARFGKLLTADRPEIETLRHIRQGMRLYHHARDTKRPMSVGVFGPPGAGKSFGVMQLAVEVFGDKSWKEFNLSQFRDSSDLNGAFHDVRDMALAGLTPVALWDEFDSRKLYWLQYLLAPMQDGRFQDGQLNHAVGKCVFVFAGGTSWSFNEFREREGTEDTFRASKGPDFVSRLDAHLDVLGPNQRSVPTSPDTRKPDPDDVSYPVRRALLIRAYLGCKADEIVDFDPNLLHALLRVPQLRHGARSLEKLIELLRDPEERVIRRSNLPRPPQLGMHVDVEAFTRLMQGEEVAAAIHETWRELSAREGWSMQPHLNRPYAELSEEDKDDNRAAAQRMEEILALAGLGMRQPGEGQEPALAPDELRSIVEQHLEVMAEAEHEGWMRQRARNGWRYDVTRDDAGKRHPAMLPYADLPAGERNKDRNSIRHYSDFAARAKYRIVRLKGDG